jgi:hypothetical protein
VGIRKKTGQVKRKDTHVNAGHRKEKTGIVIDEMVSLVYSEVNVTALE